MNNQTPFFSKYIKKDIIPLCWRYVFHENTNIATEENARYQELNLNTNYQEYKLTSVIENQYQNTAIQ